MSKASDANHDAQKRVKLSQAEYPNNSLEQALRIALALWENFAGKGAAPHQVAMAIDMSPTSGTWRNLCGSSIAYGLTEGGYAAPQISLTELGRRIVAPTEEGDDVSARVEAILQPRVMRDFLERYNKAKFPKDDIAKNVLVSMGLPKERADKSLEILKENGGFAGVVLDTKSGPFVALDNRVDLVVAPPAAGEDIGRRDKEEAANLPNNSELAPFHSSGYRPSGSDDRASRNGQRQLFVAHGKSRSALDDLKKILTDFKIPFKVAADEPNAGRPISSKVAELMRECSAGVFIFTRDEQFTRTDKDGQQREVWRPSENVIYELGAASYLWDGKIIILREEGVDFPSDFSDLGYIHFKNGEVSSKVVDLIKELIAFGMLKFELPG